MADSPNGPERGRSLQPAEAAVWVALGVVFVVVVLLFAIRCPLGPTTSRAYPSRTLPPEPAAVLHAPPPPSEDYYPCSDCHEGEETNRNVRVLEEEHDDLTLEHGDLWCLHCHDADNRDMLHRSDGELVPFEHAERLCANCHHDKYDDILAGVHGKRTGHWWGEKETFNCLQCHDPHAPHFKPLEPKPPPVPPSEMRFERQASSQEPTK